MAAKPLSLQGVNIPRPAQDLHARGGRRGRRRARKSAQAAARNDHQRPHGGDDDGAARARSRARSPCRGAACRGTCTPRSPSSAPTSSRARWTAYLCGARRGATRSAGPRVWASRSASCRLPMRTPRAGSSAVPPSCGRSGAYPRRPQGGGSPRLRETASATRGPATPNRGASTRASCSCRPRSVEKRPSPKPRGGFWRRATGA